MKLHDPAALPSDRRVGGPQSRSVRGGEEKNSQLLPGLEPPIKYKYLREIFRHQKNEGH